MCIRDRPQTAHNEHAALDTTQAVEFDFETTAAMDQTTEQPAAEEEPRAAVFDFEAAALHAPEHTPHDTPVSIEVEPSAVLGALAVVEEVVPVSSTERLPAEGESSLDVAASRWGVRSIPSASTAPPPPEGKGGKGRRPSSEQPAAAPVAEAAAAAAAGGVPASTTAHGMGSRRPPQEPAAAPADATSAVPPSTAPGRKGGRRASSEKFAAAVLAQEAIAVPPPAPQGKGQRASRQPEAPKEAEGDDFNFA
eukprot:TRINITY_DN5828_c0_g1_i1.p1 TRINITY_DN5828_c0_g1~~TRINITY_DN5828_c0_g1_i1.p1  ORF type:complete len:251 (+),score=79.09 TRINITY_DN5828_c0_g1_i1:81-833(+)